jgi:hypothetical protein
MAAGEHQLESLIGKRCSVQVVLRRLGNVQQASLGGQGAVSPDSIDRPVAGGGQQPRSRVCGRAITRPPLGGDRECLLGGFLGEVEVAEEADQCREDPAPLVAEDLLDNR